jgi:hypothetical protein
MIHILLCISGIFTWMAVGRFLYFYLWVYSEPNNGVPYSLILSGFDGVLCRDATGFDKVAVIMWPL